ncbi:DUF695 domain-containing protein [Ferruginibacter paludis]|uniref:DUF695 domain-containing protein n=1 Tax=Ferruginibacter paludis TaxID=1310417 RepID=UPI0025B28D5D|nr:DUF695 domain-containing protein [Ferruginibacter paludis]MDN3659153.1 DUF695 domain-containing protein [Ferruginibacter paludis]
MVKRYVILSLFVTLALNAFSQDDVWNVYMAAYEKGPGSTLVNMTLKDAAPMLRLPYLLTTGVRLKNCSKEGLPVKEEFNTLYQISDSVKAALNTRLRPVAAGTFSYQCERIDYYYLPDTTGIRKLLEIAYKKYFPAYQYSINIQNDAEWKGYLGFLFPNEDILDQLTNEKVILDLTDAGDDLSKPRMVDHWLYFKTDAERNSFIPYAVKEKFKVTKSFSPNTRLTYQLQLSRTDKVDLASISIITSALRKKATELHGQYDGWETVVIKKK